MKETMIARTCMPAYVIFHVVYLAKFGISLRHLEDIITVTRSLVELNCAADLSNGPVDWTVLPHCHTKTQYEPIVVSGKLRSNRTEKYYVLNSSTIQGYTLGFDVLDLSYAGTYSCFATNDFQPKDIKTNVTVVERTPRCSLIDNHISCQSSSPGSSCISRIQCSFRYKGPSILNITWKSDSDQIHFTKCDTLPGLNCSYPDVMVCNITTLHGTQTNLSSSSSADIVVVSYTQNGSDYECIWNDRNKSTTSNGKTYTFYLSATSTLIGSLECSSNSDPKPTYTPIPTFTAVMAGICVLVLVLIILTVYLVLHKGNEIRSTKSTSNGMEPPDIVESDSEANSAMSTTPAVYSVVQKNKEKHNAPIYSDVKKSKKKKIVPEYTEVKIFENEDRNANESSSTYSLVRDHGEISAASTMCSANNVVFENVMYSSGRNENQNEAVPKVPEKNFATDGTVYAELGPAPKNQTRRAPVIIEPLNKSDYAEIDHTIRAPPPPPHLLPKRKC